jgi:multidrug resistance efflux pump
MSTSFSRTLRAMEAESPRRALLALAIVGSFLLAGLGWLSYCRVGVYETSRSAHLEAGTSSNVIQAPVAGEVTAAYLQLGQAVRKGDTLVLLDSSAARLQLDVERTRHEARLREISALETEIHVQEQALESERLAKRAAIEEARTQADAARPLSRFADGELERLEQMRKAGLLSQVDYLRRHSEAEHDRLNERTALQAIARMGAELTTRESDRRGAIEQQRRQLRALEGQSATSVALISQLAFEVDRRTIRSPISGIVGDITVLRPGAYVSDGTVLATIVPAGEIHAVAEFPAGRALGRIRSGQHARLRLEGLPWGQYGSVMATVRRVAVEERQGAARVELDVSPGSPLAARLEHGLSASVDIEVERVQPALLLLRALGELAGERTVASGST